VMLPGRCAPHCPLCGTERLPGSPPPPMRAVDAAAVPNVREQFEFEHKNDVKAVYYSAA
jgi:hypothetical protein